MKVVYDWEYQPLEIDGCNRSLQFICEREKLVFTIIDRDEAKMVFERALYLQNRSGIYFGLGETEVYTGKSDRNSGGIIARIGNHLSSEKKNFIDTFIIVTSKEDNNPNYDSDIISSLEHMLYQISMLADHKTVHNSPGQTHYMMRDIFRVKSFLRAYGTVYKLLVMHHIDPFIVKGTAISLPDSDNVFSLKEDNFDVSLVLNKNRTFTVLKHSRFRFPRRVIFDNESSSILFRKLINDCSITVLPVNDYHFDLVFLADTDLGRDVKLESLTVLLKDASVVNVDKMWRNRKNISIDKFKTKEDANNNK